MTEQQTRIAEQIAQRPYLINQELNTYIQENGIDEFVYSMQTYISAHTIQISLICFQCEDSYIDQFISKQRYNNIEIVKADDSVTYRDIQDYIQNTESEFILFLENNHAFFEGMLLMMYRNLLSADVDLVLAPRDIINEEAEVISFPDPLLLNPLYEKNNAILPGKELLTLSIMNNRNLYGDLSSIMIKTHSAKRILAKYDFRHIDDLDSRIRSTALIYLLLANSTIKLLEGELSSKIIKQEKSDPDLQEIYCQYLSDIIQYLGLSASCIDRIRNAGKRLPRSKTRYKKDITFIYQNKAEYYNVLPVVKEAQKRGYRVTTTMDKQAKAEICVYQEHTNYPENAKFSAILLHDMAQGHNRWPNFWELEPWDKYDFGILPGEQWHELWRINGCMPYANPTHGVFRLGYPKSDYVTSPELIERAKMLEDKLHFKYNYTILYAASWENDGKEDDFVQALHELPVNLLIKANSWKGGYMEKYYYIEENIAEQRKLHEGKYENLYYLEQEESIMTALQMCDMVVSDESSVMGEALMFGKPSLAVIDWTIQDNPPPALARLSDVRVDYVFTCTKDKIQENVLKIMNHSVDIQKLLDRKSNMYSNIGTSSSDIMDAIDYFTNNGESDAFLEKEVQEPYYEFQSLWN